MVFSHVSWLFLILCWFFEAFQGVRLLGAVLDRVPGARERCGLDLELEILQF